MKPTLDARQIEILRDIPELIPVLRNYYESWSIKVYNRKYFACKNYLSPNRRDFYKVLLIAKGLGVFTLGLSTYHIDEPTLIFIHPNDIISWKRLSDDHVGHYVLFRKEFVNNFPSLRTTMDKLQVFSDRSKNVIRLSDAEASVIDDLFVKMHAENDLNGVYKEDALQAYIQLLMVEGLKMGKSPKPDTVNDEYSHIHHFFDSLEKEISGINYDTPLRIRTAKEFAGDLGLHPNYLNELLKKHTGQTASTHIRNRLLDEAKALLLQTDWNLTQISFALGFSDQPNFSYFFKKNAGLTPLEFRKSNSVSAASA